MIAVRNGMQMCGIFELNGGRRNGQDFCCTRLLTSIVSSFRGMKSLYVVSSIRYILIARKEETVSAAERVGIHLTLNTLNAKFVDLWFRFRICFLSATEFIQSFF
jgi:hypothetical protein